MEEYVECESTREYATKGTRLTIGFGVSKKRGDGVNIEEI